MTVGHKPEWFNKHPCTGCRTGYIECAQGLVLNLMCCKDCEHPGGLGPDAFTPEEIADMQRYHAERKSS